MHTSAPRSITAGNRVNKQLNLDVGPSTNNMLPWQLEGVYGWVHSDKIILAFSA